MPKHLLTYNQWCIHMSGSPKRSHECRLFWTAEQEVIPGILNQTMILVIANLLVSEMWIHFLGASRDLGIVCGRLVCVLPNPPLPVTSVSGTDDKPIWVLERIINSYWSQNWYWTFTDFQNWYWSHIVPGADIELGTCRGTKTQAAPGLVLIVIQLVNLF